jgi:predicted protein tyrosine phosphatase
MNNWNGQDLSNKIRDCRDGVVHNPYQSNDKKVVFVCSMGILRSATAARLYANRYNTRAAGTWADSLIPLTSLLIEWADEIVFVNQHNFDQACERFPKEMAAANVVHVLNIPDNYEHMHPKLIEAFEEQYEPVTQ